MRLAADAPHQFGGIELDRDRPLRFRLNGQEIAGFAGDTVLSAALAAGLDTYGTLGTAPLGLSAEFCPLVAGRRGGEPLPMERLPAVDGLDLVSVGRRRAAFGATPHSLRHRLEDPVEPDWQHRKPEATLAAELLIVGGGIAGLAAAKAAAAAGRTVILAERRPWFGGDARYFGAVGDEETPEAVSSRLIAQLGAEPNVTLLARAEVSAIHGLSATLHHVVVGDGPARGRVVTVVASRILIATGAMQRLPIFPGNRRPGVVSAVAAYHLAKRYGVALGTSAVVSTQSNHAYRLALRLHDSGIAIRRVADTRIQPQSRFVDFAKASGLTLASGQLPFAAKPGHFSFANVGSSTANAEFEAEQLIVGGAWQPELTLWMLSGGGVRWDAGRGALVAAGSLETVALAGAALGLRSMRACLESGRSATEVLFGATPATIEDSEPGTDLETPDAPTPFVAATVEQPSFLATGSSLATRATLPATHALSLSDVAAAVELGLFAPIDAGAIAAERGAPGPDLVASSWRPAPRPAGSATPAYLVNRFGIAPQRVHLVVDHRRRFEVGALIYPVGVSPAPELAIGVIVEARPVGGMALIAEEALADGRFVVETTAGPSPARPKRD